MLVAGFRSTVYPVAMKCSICRGSFVYILYHVKDGSSLFFLLAGVSNRERLSRFLQSHFLYLLGDLWPHSNAVLNICEDVCSVSKVVPALFYWAWLLEGSGHKNTALSRVSYLQRSSIKYCAATADSFTVYTTVYF